jgi:hypothetical protein
MKETEAKSDLNQLIEGVRQGVVQQQEATAALASQRPRQSNTKNVLGYGLLAGLIVVAFFQYPRINAPYVWPDTDTVPAAAEADLEAVIGVIETYRFSQGQYPTTLSQIRFPDSLVQMMKASTLDYAPNDKGYSLAWARPNWLAKYDSETGKISVEPKGKR